MKGNKVECTCKARINFEVTRSYVTVRVNCRTPLLMALTDLSDNGVIETKV